MKNKQQHIKTLKNAFTELVEVSFFSFQITQELMKLIQPTPKIKILSVS